RVGGEDEAAVQPFRVGGPGGVPALAAAAPSARQDRVMVRAVPAGHRAAPARLVPAIVMGAGLCRVMVAAGWWRRLSGIPGGVRLRPGSGSGGIAVTVSGLAGADRGQQRGQPPDLLVGRLGPLSYVGVGEPAANPLSQGGHLGGSHAGTPSPFLASPAANSRT